MKTAKLFQNGNSQAIRLPKEFQFKGKEVYIKRFEDMVIILPKKKDPWKIMLEGIYGFSDDFMKERNQPPTQERSIFFE
ncbi:antitoxin [Candidatus Peregrinibacteria bacterium]|nr:antitoxin [Candidatus Peregrinibacteria bacterium]